MLQPSSTLSLSQSSLVTAVIAAMFDSFQGLSWIRFRFRCHDDDSHRHGSCRLFLATQLFLCSVDQFSSSDQLSL